MAGCVCFSTQFFYINIKRGGPQDTTRMRRGCDEVSANGAIWFPKEFELQSGHRVVKKVLDTS